MAVQDIAFADIKIGDRAHESSSIKRLTQELLTNFRKDMRQINCSMLKIQYRTGPDKCLQVLVKTARLLDSIVERELPELWESRVSKA